MLLLEEIIVESDSDLEIVSTVAVGFDDDKNFVVELEMNDYESRRGNQRHWAVVEKEDALMLADYLKVKLTVLPKVFDEKFGESGAFVLSYVEARFKEILDFLLDCGVHYQLITK